MAKVRRGGSVVLDGARGNGSSFVLQIAASFVLRSPNRRPRKIRVRFALNRMDFHAVR